MLPSGDLSELGFVKNWIVEAIVSSYDKDRSPNAAPMGLTTEDMKSLILRPFKTSQTYSNLIRWRGGVANLTSDPEIFHLTTFKDANPGGVIPQGWFAHAEVVDAPSLKMADASIEFRVVKVRDIAEDRVELLCRVEKTILARSPVTHVYSRAAPAIIESLIHATRIQAFLKSGEEEKAEELIQRIDHYRKIVDKVAPESRYSAIMEDITRRIKSWKSQS